MDRPFSIPPRVTGGLAIVSSLTMFSGAMLLLASGLDLDAALATGTMADYLAAVPEARGLAVANLVVWIIGVMLWGIAGDALSRLPATNSTATLLARSCYRFGIPLVVAAYTAWLVVVVVLGGDTSESTITMGTALGWFASRADWIATILVVGLGPLFLSLGGRGTWAPRWLLVWGGIAAFCGALNAVAMLTGGAGLTSYGFVIIPVGLGWQIAAGVRAIRYPATS